MLKPSLQVVGQMILFQTSVKMTVKELPVETKIIVLPKIARGLLRGTLIIVRHQIVKGSPNKTKAIALQICVRLGQVEMPITVAMEIAKAS